MEVEIKIVQSIKNPLYEVTKLAERRKNWLIVHFVGILLLVGMQLMLIGIGVPQTIMRWWSALIFIWGGIFIYNSAALTTKINKIIEDNSNMWKFKNG